MILLGPPGELRPEDKVRRTRAAVATPVRDGLLGRILGGLGSSIVALASGEGWPGLRFVAPCATTAMAGFVIEAGRDVLIVHGDLMRHARAYREPSLLLRRPPGREAYPGDIFYVRARLLERATHLAAEQGARIATRLAPATACGAPVAAAGGPPRMHGLPGSVDGLPALVRAMILDTDNWLRQEGVTRLVPACDRSEGQVASRSQLAPLLTPRASGGAAVARCALAGPFAALRADGNGGARVLAGPAA